MAPRQLRLELNEVDITADKGSKRVPADSTDKSSTQQPRYDCARPRDRLWHLLTWPRTAGLAPEHWPELRL
eukprot:scaffold33993_cov122-Isochrysis_galbana.AAC.2